MVQAVPIASFRPGMGKQRSPNFHWFMTVSPGRSKMHSGRDICGSRNEIRQIGWTIADMYKVHQDTSL